MHSYPRSSGIKYLPIHDLSLLLVAYWILGIYAFYFPPKGHQLLFFQRSNGHTQDSPWLHIQCAAADEGTSSCSFCLLFQFFNLLATLLFIFTCKLDYFYYLRWMGSRCNLERWKLATVKVWLLNWNFFVSSCTISLANNITAHNWLIFDTRPWTAVKGHKHINSLL